MAGDPFVTRLRREIEGWIREGVITPEQGSRLAGRYPDEAGGPSRFVAIVSLVGAVLVVAGVALVIAHNWERLGDGVKIGGLSALMVAAYAGAFTLRERSLRRTGEALMMAAGALFLCGIALVGQIYHLNARPPNAVLLWLAAILPIAFLLRAAPLFFLGVCGTIVWIGMEGARPDSWIYLGGPRWDGFNVGHQILAPSLGALLLALGGVVRGRLEVFRRSLESPGALLFLGGVYVLSFQHHRFYAELHGPSGLARAPQIFFALIALGAMALAWLLWPGARLRRSALCRMLTLGIATAILPLYGLREILPGANPERLMAWWCFAFGLAASILFISTGLHWGRPDWITSGLLCVGLNIITRYFDVFGDRLNQGLVFVGGGLLLLVMAILLERQRRHLIRLAALREGS